MKVLICSIVLCALVSSCYQLEQSTPAIQVDIRVSPVNEQDPLLLLFSAQFSKVPPSTVQWDFGDGYSNNQHEVTHRYLVPGNYQATLQYSLEGTFYERVLAVNISGNKSELLIKTEQAVTLDSDSNDPNQPFISNNAIPQKLSPPIQLSGIVMQANICQAGKLCKDGDLNDDYSFTLNYGDYIQVNMIKGSVDLILSTELGAHSKYFNDITNQLMIPASQLGQGDYHLRISLDKSEDKAQYILNIQQANLPTTTASKNYQPGKLIVMWKDTTLPELIDISDPRLINLNEQDIHAVKQRLAAKPEVSNVSLNYIRRSHSSQYNNQWPLIFQDISSLWTPLSVRGSLPGEHVTVAVIDTGIYSQHPNFKNLVFRDGFDFISDPINALDGNGWDSNPEDPGDNQLSFHGSHVTGIIAAQPNHAELAPDSITGVAWGADIMPLRVLGADGGTSYDLIQALRYAAGLKNDTGRYPAKPADIINLSLGGIEFSAAEQATIDEVINSGAVIVAATGNQGRNQVNYPASYQNVIAVGATDRQGNLSSYSNSGPFIDIVAPGGECNDTTCTGGIRSIGATGALRNSSDQRQPDWTNLAGTSMAAAHVSALLSILRSSLPSLDAFDLSSLLKSGALTKNEPDSHEPTSFSRLTGWGTLDSRKILELIDTSNLNQGGIWTTNPKITLSPFQTIRLPLLVRGSSSELHIENHTQNLNAHIDEFYLTISAQEFFTNPAKIVISANNMKALTIQIQPSITELNDNNIHHLYLKRTTDIGNQDLGRASKQPSGWHAFIDSESAIKDIQASTDIDYDGVYCEPGEFCAYEESEIAAKDIITLGGRVLTH